MNLRNKFDLTTDESVTNETNIPDLEDSVVEALSGVGKKVLTVDGEIKDASEKYSSDSSSLEEKTNNEVVEFDMDMCNYVRRFFNREGYSLQELGNDLEKLGFSTFVEENVFNDLVELLDIINTQNGDNLLKFSRKHGDYLFILMDIIDYLGAKIYKGEEGADLEADLIYGKHHVGVDREKLIEDMSKF